MALKPENRAPWEDRLARTASGFDGVWDWVATPSDTPPIAKGTYISKIWCVPAVDRDGNAAGWFACARTDQLGHWVLSYMFLYLAEDTGRFEKRAYSVQLEDKATAVAVGNDFAHRMATSNGRRLILDQIFVESDDWEKIERLLTEPWAREGLTLEDQ